MLGRKESGRDGFPLPRIFGTLGRNGRPQGLEGAVLAGPTDENWWAAKAPGEQGVTSAEGRDSQASRSGSFSGP